MCAARIDLRANFPELFFYRARHATRSLIAGP
jgi:hypothetical protein